MVYNSYLTQLIWLAESREKAIDAFLEDKGYKNMGDKEQACTENEIIAYLDCNWEFVIADL